MNRYIIYNFMLMSFINLMMYVPHILVERRYSGAVSSILVGTAIGTLLVYLYTSAIARYPGMGLPEIIKLNFPRWVAAPILLGFAAIWWFATTMVTVSYSILVNRFLNPDVNTTVILCLLIIACGYAATRSTLTVAFVTEIGMMINAPVIIFILFKAVKSPQLNFDAIRVVAGYITVMPTLTCVAAATFTFTGYITLSISNRLFPPNFRFKFRWVYPVFGLIILLITFFVPIGFHGTEAVNQYIYIWSVTADSLLMQYGFIERVLFLFLIVFLNLALVFTMAGWHQAMEFVKSFSYKHEPEIDSPQTPVSNYVIVGIFMLLAYIYLMLTNEKLNMQITSWWLVVRMFFEICVVTLMFALSRRRSSSA